MAIEIRRATDDDVDEIRHVDQRGFGFGFTDEEFALIRPTLDMQRFFVACEAGRIVGVCGVFAFDTSLPGGATVPAGGLTWVSVAATHRRRGVLRSLMDATHADIDERGEVLATLGASEGGIYERFGYGVASQGRMVEIDVRAARWRSGTPAATSQVRFVEGDELRAHVVGLWERYRRSRPLEVTRNQAWIDDLVGTWARPDGGASQAYVLAHPDGYAVYRITQDWNLGLPTHQMQLAEFVAVTPAAHAALWSVLLSMDLVGTIRTRVMPIDDPLSLLLENARVVRTTALTDHQWVNVRDVATAFAARSYGVADRLVLEADGVRWAVEGGPDGADCRKVRSRPDLVVDHSALGSLLAGGMHATYLAAGGRLQGSTDAVRRADAFFHTAPAPFGQTFY